MRPMQRYTKPSQSIGVTIAVPHNSFSPTPNMTPMEIAFHKGRDAKRRGRPATNPHSDPALAVEWERGYNS